MVGREAPGRVERVFVKAASPASDRAFWLAASIASTSSGEPAHAEGVAVTFERRDGAANVAVKHTLSLPESALGEGAHVDWELPGDSGEHVHFGERASHGSVSTNRSTVAWELTWSGNGLPFIPVSPDRFLASRLPNRTLTPEPDLRATGSITVNGVRWEVASWPGMVGRHIATEPTEQSAYMHCNQWNEPTDLVIEAVTTQTRAGRFFNPTVTTVCLRHEGRDYQFNGWLQLLATRTELSLRRYEFSAANQQGKVDAVVDAAVENFVGLHYTQPRGAITHGLHATLAHARVRFVPTDGDPVAVSSSAASLEIATARRDHGVRMLQ